MSLTGQVAFPAGRGQAYAFLASPDADVITGVCLEVDDGRGV